MKYKNITTRNLRTLGACHKGVQWVEQCGKVKTLDVLEALKAHRFDWANWLIVRVMDREQRIKYALFAAKQVIGMYEDKYPKDDRPRKAIEAVEKYLKSPTEKNRKAAYAACPAYAAYTAAYAAAAYPAYAAYAAAAAAYAAAAYAAARKEMQDKIIDYGIELLKY